MSDESSKANGTNPAQRLPSFKPPRDLSLGGVKQKKVFIPNLNVSRNKSKGQANSSSQDSTKDERHRHRDRNNKPRFKNGPNVIKSSGVFSEGLGRVERHSSRAAYSRDASDSAVHLLRPTIRVKDVVKIDKELEEQKIKYVLGEDNEGMGETYDFKRVRERDAPIKLPMDDGGFLRNKAPKVKQEFVVKEEPIDEDTVLPSLPDVKKDVYDTPDIINLMKSEEPKIMLLQFPQSLPGQARSTDDDPPRKKYGNQSASSSASAASSASTASTASSSNETGDTEPTPEVDKTCSLADLEEGKIGKLRVYHSGRVTLKLGDTEFDVSMGTQAAFHQEVVSVACDEASRSANIISLGPLAHKLNVVPDWERMFKKMNVSMGTQAAFHQEVVSVACDEASRSANIISLGPLTHKLNVVPDWERMFKKMNV